MAATAEVPQDIGVRDLLEAGLHFGHQTKRWNPKMKRYIFDKRNGIHIIDLSKSLVLLKEALEFVYDVVVSGKPLLFVGTKKQAQQVIKNAAETCGQHYVTNRWLGGTLTNSATIRRSIQRMKQIEEQEKDGTLATMHKKEAARTRRELEKLRRNLGGIADMTTMPGAMFVVDIARETIAVAEANKLGIPVIAIVDTNCDPDAIDYVIPGNDDAIRAIKRIANAVAETGAKAAGEYAKIAAERARKAEEERKLAEQRQKEAAKLAEEQKAAAEAKEKAKQAKQAAEQKSAAKAKKEAAKRAAEQKTEKAADKAADKTESKAEPKAEKAADKAGSKAEPKDSGEQSAEAASEATAEAAGASESTPEAGAASPETPPESEPAKDA